MLSLLLSLLVMLAVVAVVFWGYNEIQKAMPMPPPVRVVVIVFLVIVLVWFLLALLGVVPGLPRPRL